MLLIFVLPAILLVAIFFLVLQHVLIYLWDPKGLRKYPGLNHLSGITNLAYIYESCKSGGFRTRALHEAHQANSVLRLGPNSLSFRDIRAIRDIYGHSTTCIKGDMYSVTAGPHPSLLDVVDKERHSTKRKRLAAAFAAKNLEGWEYKVVDKCTRLVRQFDLLCSQSPKGTGSEGVTVDWRLWSNLFTVEAIADIALSQHLGLLEAATDAVIAQDATGNTRRVSFIRSLHGIGRVAAPIVWSTKGYPFLKKILSVFETYRAELINNATYDDIVRHLVSKRMDRYQNGEKLDDFFACLLEDKSGSPVGLELGEIQAEVNVFLNAGSDTTAIALTHVLYYLLKNPDKLDRLRRELDMVLDTATVVPTYASVRNIAYLRACLDEALRLSPPVSFGLQRKTPAGGASINGQWIPGDTFVSVPAYTAHRDSTIFPEAESYLPERWLGDCAKAVQKYFIPFSMGSRGCIGRNISYLEQHVLLATLVRRYDFALPYRDWELDWEEQFNLWPSAMPLKISYRQVGG